MKKTFSVLFALAVAGAVGCSGDDGPTTVETEPQARVRYFNASPDAPASTEAVFVDRVENTFTFRRVGFRGSSGEYQAVNVGTRQFRVFRSLTTLSNGQTIDTAQVVVLDTTFTLAADRRYTILQVGSSLAARGTAGAASIVLFEDTLPETVAPGTISVRLYNALPGAGNASVTIAPSTTAGVGAAVATVNSIPFLGRSAYVSIPALARSDTSAFYRFAVASSVAPFASTPRAMSAVPTAATLSAAGDSAIAATATAPAQPARAGWREPGSVISAFIVPAGTTTATNTPAVVPAPDRPPRP